MQRRFRPLAAARQSDTEVNNAAPSQIQGFPLPKRQRVGVAAACELCRKRKSRCDGQRPSCDRCRREGVECSYVTAQGETHQTALKRKYQLAMEENQQLRELFTIIHESPAIEADEVYKRIRTTDDPIEVLQLIKQADLLLPTPRQLAATVDGLGELQGGHEADEIFRLPRRPWSVAGTDRIVPEMMANLFLKRSILSRSLADKLSQYGAASDAMSID